MSPADKTPDPAILAASVDLFDGDQRRLDAKGEGVTRIVFVPRGEVLVHDVWFTTGLRGTGPEAEFPFF